MKPLGSSPRREDAAMNDLSKMTTESLQDWWGTYSCPRCLSKIRATLFCEHLWHLVPSVTYACDASAFSPISIPIVELVNAGVLGDAHFLKYGLVWTAADAPAARLPIDSGV